MQKTPKPFLLIILFQTTYFLGTVNNNLQIFLYAQFLALQTSPILLFPLYNPYKL